jgi:hypothetical protein
MILRLLTIVTALSMMIAACRPAREQTLARVAAAERQWPNEPQQFMTLTDQPWDRIVMPAPQSGLGWVTAKARALLLEAPGQENNWRYLRRSSSKDDDIVADSAAPASAPNVLRIIFTTDMQRDHEPSVHFVGLPRVTEVYSGWWMKLSPNWTCSPAGCGKITFLLPDGADPGVIYSNLAGRDGSHYVNVATTWPSTGYKFWANNIAQTLVVDDRWYRVEWYVKWASTPGGADGIIRWWVNGELNGDHRSVTFPPIPAFLEFQHASTRQNPPPTEQYMYIDHTYVSVPVQPVK